MQWPADNHRALHSARIPLPDKEIPSLLETAWLCSDLGWQCCPGHAKIDAQTDNFQRNVLHSQDIALRFLLAETPVSGEQHKI